jgi:CheY-like chemotaxis protein
MPKKCVIGVADHFIAHLLERFAEQSGMQTVRANSGQALLEIAQRVKPDFIIVDNELPGTIQGEEVIWALRSNAGTSQIPLVLCSWLPATEAQALFGEMTAYLAKPKLDYQGFLAAASLVAHSGAESQQPSAATKTDSD